MTVKPITMEQERIHIHADRRLAFQVLTAFGAQAGEGPRNEVIEDNGNRKFIRFRTAVRFAGKSWIMETTEWVTLTEPERIDFELVPGQGPIRGGLKLLRDRFAFEDRDGCTELAYDSTFGIRWSWGGWLLGRLVFKRTMRSLMRRHLQEVKQTIEDRASKSRVFPQNKTCKVTTA